MLKQLKTLSIFESMKATVTIILVWNVFLLRAQEEVTSFYFSEPQPSSVTPLEKFDDDICGRYLYAKDTLTSLIITPDSIYTHFGTFTYLASKEIEASDKYSLKNDLLYGIKEGQGIPYKERNDTIFTYVTQNDLLFKPTKIHKLNKSGDKFYLNTKEDNGFYSTEVFSLEEKQLIVYSIDHEQVLEEILQFKSTKTMQVDGFKTYLSAPTKSEFISFVENKGFRDKTVYLDSKKL